MRKLSASALTQFLRSPKSYYWRYVKRIEPILPSVAPFGHDLLFGSLWHECTDRFYKGVDESINTKQTMDAWLTGSEGWVPDKARDTKTKALEALMPQYYQMFRPDDGYRTYGSELWLEDNRFVAKLDGLGDGNIVHETKTASRCPSLSEQLWKIGHSLQVKLYCVMANAQGYCIEFAYKDPPHQIFRGPIECVTTEQKQQWKHELDALADSIYALGTDEANYPCHPDGCCLITKGMVSMCPFQVLCSDGLTEENGIAFKTREHK